MLTAAENVSSISVPEELGASCHQFRLLENLPPQLGEGRNSSLFGHGGDGNLGQLPQLQAFPTHGWTFYLTWISSLDKFSYGGFNGLGSSKTCLSKGTAGSSPDKKNPEFWSISKNKWILETINWLHIPSSPLKYFCFFILVLKARISGCTR